MGEELSIGTRVFCFIPDGVDVYDDNDFNAGWSARMDSCVDEWGTIESIGEIKPNGRRDFLIRFEHNSAQWWWDELYVNPAGVISDSTIEESDFVSILE